MQYLGLSCLYLTLNHDLQEKARQIFGGPRDLMRQLVVPPALVVVPRAAEPAASAVKAIASALRVEVAQGQGPRFADLP